MEQTGDDTPSERRRLRSNRSNSGIKYMKKREETAADYLKTKNK